MRAFVPRGTMAFYTMSILESFLYVILGWVSGFAVAVATCNNTKEDKTDE